MTKWSFSFCTGSVILNLLQQQYLHTWTSIVSMTKISFILTLLSNIGTKEILVLGSEDTHKITARHVSSGSVRTLNRHSWTSVKHKKSMRETRWLLHRFVHWKFVLNLSSYESLYSHRLNLVHSFIFETLLLNNYRIVGNPYLVDTKILCYKSVLHWYLSMIYVILVVSPT